MICHRFTINPKTHPAMTRDEWTTAYRNCRVFRRLLWAQEEKIMEATNRAFRDMMIYGTSVTRVGL